METLVAATQSGVTRSGGTCWAVVKRRMVPSSWLTSLDSSAAWSVITMMVIPEVHGLKRTEKKANMCIEYRRLLFRLLIISKW